MQELFKYLNLKSILILGMGKEGKSTLAFLEKFQDQFTLSKIGIADQNPKALQVNTKLPLTKQTDYLDSLKNYDLIIKSPGIVLKDVLGLEALNISSQTDLFFRFSNLYKTAITGTKGKSTTTALVNAIQKRRGRSFILGNFGTPIFDEWAQITDEDFLVLESSSHQLEYLKKSPNNALITNFYPEHLDHYQDYNAYLNAKLNIIRYQDEKDHFVLNADDPEIMKRAFPLIQGGFTVVTSSPQPPVTGYKRWIQIEKTAPSDFLRLYIDGEPLDFSNLPKHLSGIHHAYDIAFATALALEAGMDFQTIQSGVQHFEGIPHRCQFVGRYQAIDFYNDSIATIPESTLFAIDTLQTVDTLIVGGMDRGIDYTAFVEQLKKRSISNIICLPDTGKKIEDSFIDSPTHQLYVVKTVEEAVKMSYKHTKKPGICLFSPAASSYNRYKSFEERGEDFMHWVKIYGEVN